MDYPVYGKRFGNEYLDIREFVTPFTPSVRDVLAGISAEGDRIWNCWDWVCHNIKYPPSCNDVQDFHEKVSFLRGCPIIRMPVKRSSKIDDFWELPWETLDPPRYGDCEGSATVLVSLLRNFMPENEVYCTVGTYTGWGHAWVSIVQGSSFFTLDTTIPEAKIEGVSAVAEGDPYVPYIRFNDKLVIEERDGWQDFCNFPRNKQAKMDALYAHYRIQR
ncbi:MAG: hypothetical protein PHO67_08080 [Candidatus Omnitrophica bacterium]|nr:hypothetical protein [Candidatus Omnitrophota bacterium]